MVVQWDKNAPIFLNVFTYNKNFYFDLHKGLVKLHYNTYESYYEELLNYTPHFYLPVKASTLDELKLEHPELFL